MKKCIALLLINVCGVMQASSKSESVIIEVHRIKNKDSKIGCYIDNGYFGHDNEHVFLRFGNDLLYVPIDTINKLLEKQIDKTQKVTDRFLNINFTQEESREISWKLTTDQTTFKVIAPDKELSFKCASFYGSGASQDTK